MSMKYYYQRETILETLCFPEGTVSGSAASLGYHGHEPILVAMDAMIRYAKAYQTA